MKRFFLVPILGLATLAAASPARAQSTGWLDIARPSYGGERQSYYDARRTAYDNGYREGLKEGEKDGRRNERFEYQDERTYQRADKGYHREFGNEERYRQSFRTGYAAGYSDAYQRFGAGYGNRRTYPGRDSRGPVYYPDTRNNYPGGSYPGGIRGGSTNAAFQLGADDGYQKGVEDARKHRSFDPLRHEWYRSGDRHYEGRFGPREQYKDVYRRGFQEGYERAYRGGQYR
jgi:flagellar biosynthesis/type III secretory pathway protein FliH